MMSSFEDKKFKQLQRKWYRKLERVGFEDIEETRRSGELMKVWHCSYFQRRYEPELFKAKRKYYEMACQFLEGYPRFQFEVFFQSEREKQIWEMHSKGVPLRTIASSFRTKVCRIHKIIKELRIEMMEESWET